MAVDAIVIFSGGLDSTTLLFNCLQDGLRVSALSFDYGQRHRRELEHAKRILEVARSRYPMQVHEHHVLDLSPIAKVFAGSSQTSKDIAVPEGHYAAETMKLTVVPNRNMVMISIAGAYAISVGASKVFYGAHAGDHAIYPDCRQEFVNAARTALLEADWKKVWLHAPFVSARKQDIAALGFRMGAPLELTWSCYNAGEVHCGTCGTCVERKEAFALARLTDPTVYLK